MAQTTTRLLKAVFLHMRDFTWGCIALFMCILFTSAPAHAADNERYKAIPMASGGYVFIIDTREGHTWTWNSARQGQTSPSGQNPRIEYQGNVRKNMTTPPKISGHPSPAPTPPSAQPERF